MMPATVWVNPDITNGKWQTLGVTAAMGEEIKTAVSNVSVFGFMGDRACTCARWHSHFVVSLIDCG